MNKQSLSEQFRSNPNTIIKKDELVKMFQSLKQENLKTRIYKELKSFVLNNFDDSCIEHDSSEIEFSLYGRTIEVDERSIQIESDSVLSHISEELKEFVDSLIDEFKEEEEEV